MKRFEHPLTLLAGDSGSTIDDPDVDPTSHGDGAGFDADALAPAVAQCVVDEVGQGPFDQEGVGVNGGRGPRAP